MIYLLKIRKLASCSTALYGPTVLYGPPVVDAVLHAYDNFIDIEDILQGQESELPRSGGVGMVWFIINICMCFMLCIQFFFSPLL